MILGLTGAYCAGKNAAAALLEKQGFVCIDVDKLGHEALRSPAIVTALCAHFGPSILDAQGNLDRRAIGAIVFKNPEELAWEESVVHPEVSRILAAQINAAEAQGAEICLNAALLYRMPEAKLCEAVIEVRAPLYARLIRGCARDDLGIVAVLRRIRRQKNFWKLGPKLGIPIIILINKGRPEELSASLAGALAKARAAALCSQTRKGGADPSI